MALPDEGQRLLGVERRHTGRQVDARVGLLGRLVQAHLDRADRVARSVEAEQVDLDEVVDGEAGQVLDGLDEQLIAAGAPPPCARSRSEGRVDLALAVARDVHPGVAREWRRPSAWPPPAGMCSTIIVSVFTAPPSRLRAELGEHRRAGVGRPAVVADEQDVLRGPSRSGPLAPRASTWRTPAAKLRYSAQPWPLPSSTRNEATAATMRPPRTSRRRPERAGGRHRQRPPPLGGRSSPRPAPRPARGSSRAGRVRPCGCSPAPSDSPLTATTVCAPAPGSLVAPAGVTRDRQPEAGVRRSAAWEPGRGERPLHPVARRLRARGQRLGGLPAAAPRHRGLAGAHRAVLQPHRLRRVDAAGSSTGRPSRRSSQGIADRGVLGRCDAVLSGYLGLGRHRARRRRHGRAGARGQPRRRLLLRPGHRRRRPRRVRPARHRGVPARRRRAGRRRRHAQPLRARPARRHDDHLAGRGEGRRRRRAGARARASCSRRRWSPTTPPTTASTCSPPRAAGTSGCARRGWTSRSTAPATRSPRCSSRTGCAPARPAEALGRAAASVFGLLAAHRGRRLAGDPAGRRAGGVRVPHAHLRGRPRSEPALSPRPRVGAGPPARRGGHPSPRRGAGTPRRPRRRAARRPAGRRPR